MIFTEEPDTILCGYCLGDGILDGKECEECNGTGLVDIEEVNFHDI